MNLEIENFGKIKKASINLEGLTVITGENDTGKSTVGKILFWIINGINTYPNEIKEILRPIYEINLSNTLSYLARKNYQLPKELEKFADNSLSKKIDFFSFSEINQAIENTITFIGEKNLTQDIVVKKYFDDLKKIINIDDYGKLTLTLFINGKEIFKENLNNSVDKETVAKIKLSLINENIFSLDIKNDKFQDIFFDKEKSRILWNNVDFIETPLMVDGVNKQSGKIWERKFFKKYKDKIVNIKENTGFNIIKDLLDADIVIDDDGKLLFKKSINSKELDMLNIATGAKSFVILDILKKLGNFETNSITVFDEPENHLHPAWQIKYAELLINFIKNGANIVLTTHSPYMVQALKYYIDKENLNKDKFRFLLSEKIENNRANLNDVTDELYKIFDVLEKPLFDVTPEE